MPQNKTKSNSNHLALKIISCAELVPKSFSTKVAAPMATAKISKYNPAAEVEKIELFNLSKMSFIRISYVFMFLNNLQFICYAINKDYYLNLLKHAVKMINI